MQCVDGYEATLIVYSYDDVWDIRVVPPNGGDDRYLTGNGEEIVEDGVATGEFKYELDSYMC